jgi:hypothetical protein
MGSGNPIRIEPSADQRQVAAPIRSMFLALVEQGFTADEALRFMAIHMATLGTGGSEDA